MKLHIALWESVSKETITNFFQKTGISEANQVAAIKDANDPFQGLSEELETLQALESDLVNECLSAENMVHVEKDVITTTPMLTDADTHWLNSFPTKGMKTLKMKTMPRMNVMMTMAILNLRKHACVPRWGQGNHECF